MPKMCHYRFPCHPRDMIAGSPDLDPTARILRMHMIETIAELSQKYNQTKLDNKVYIDVDDFGNIQGLDVSKLIGLNANFCLGRSVPLKQMTDMSWTSMRI